MDSPQAAPQSITSGSGRQLSGRQAPDSHARMQNNGDSSSNSSGSTSTTAIKEEHELAIATSSGSGSGSASRSSHSSRSLQAARVDPFEDPSQPESMRASAYRHDANDKVGERCGVGVVGEQGGGGGGQGKGGLNGRAGRCGCGRVWGWIGQHGYGGFGLGRVGKYSALTASVSGHRPRDGRVRGTGVQGKVGREAKGRDGR